MANLGPKFAYGYLKIHQIQYESLIVKLNHAFKKAPVLEFIEKLIPTFDDIQKDIYHFDMLKIHFEHIEFIKMKNIGNRISLSVLTI